MRILSNRLLLPLAALYTVGCLPTSTDPSDPDKANEVGDTESPSDPTDPGEPEPYGPFNTWWHADTADVPAGLSGTGWHTGDTAYNFTLQDQHGDPVELYQFYGKLIVLDVFAVWCGTCNTLAPDGEQIWQALQDRGVVFLALTQEDAEYAPPTSETAAGWAASHGLTHPVLADFDKEMNPFYVIGQGYPTFPVLGPDMTILTNDLYPPTIPGVEALLDQVGM